jgi:hypothetical protein
MCYYSIHTILLAAATDKDAVSATIVAGGQARIRLNIEVNRNPLISTLFYWIY